MKESVVYQKIIQEGIQQSIQQGIQQSIQQGIQQTKNREINLILRMCQKRFGSLDENTEAKINNLSFQQLEDLGIALLDFQSESNLRLWLDSHYNE